MKQESFCADGFDENDHFEKIMEKYSDMVYRLAYALVKNRYDADDIYQEVFLCYFRKKPVFLGEEHEKAWFLRVTMNRCRNHWKSAWMRRITELTEDDRLEETRMEEEGFELIETVRTLPEKYRAVIHLFYYEDMSIEEISNVLRAKPSTVRTRLTRARRLLKERLEESDV